MSEKKQKIFLLISIFLNCVIFGLEVFGIFLTAKKYGIGLFKFYTQLSNLFTLVVSGGFVAYGICLLVYKKLNIPMWLKLLRFMSTSCLALTIIVVVAVLAPMTGAGGYQILMFTGSSIIHHFLCPVLSIVSFVFFELKPELKLCHTIYALIPTVAYAVVLLALNLFKVLEGPYPFLMVYNQSWYVTIIWAIAILGGAYFFDWLLYLGNVKFEKAINNVSVSSDNDLYGTKID